MTGLLSGWTDEAWFAASYSSGTALTVRLTNAGPNSDVEVTAVASCGNTVRGSTGAGPAPKQFVLPDNGPHPVIIRVRSNRWDIANPMFTVSFSAN